MKRFEIHPTALLLALGALLLSFASVVEIEAGPQRLGNASDSSEVDIDPALKEEVFAAATELLQMTRSAGISNLLSIRKHVQEKNIPQAMDAALKNASCPKRESLGDPGYLLSLLLIAKSQGASGYSQSDVQALCKKTKANKDDLEDVPFQKLFREWKSSLPRSQRLSNNETMDFKTLLRNPFE